MLTLLSIGILASAFGIHPVTSQSTAYVSITIRVVPPLIEYRYNVTGKEFMIAVVVENGYNLWSFDTRPRWNTKWLEYVSHT